MAPWLTSACLPVGALDPPLIANLLSKLAPVVGDGSLTYKSRQRRTGKFDDRAVSRLATEKRVESLRVEGAFGQLSLHGLSGANTEIIDVEGVAPGSWCDHLVQLPLVTAIYSGDAEDAFWQSERKVSSYKVFGRATDHLTTVGNDADVDISDNPGRRVALPGMWLWAAALMWFAPGAFEYIDRQKLESFPGATVTSCGGALEMIHIELYNINDQGETIRSRQRAFQEWIGFSKIEAEARGHISPVDAGLEIATGNFAHGGVRLLTQFLDSDESAPVRKSEAFARRMVELAADGSVLWTDVDRIR